MSRPAILVSNDDGIHAPGITALIQTLVESGSYDVYVCAPSTERSAQSHAITLGRYLSCSPVPLPGVVSSYAVDGTPADTVKLALASPIFEDVAFDLVLSGINRGENCGLHVYYSGTVGAAREASCKGVPALAFSYHDYKARAVTDYKDSAKIAAAFTKRFLELPPENQQTLAGVVINVNFPEISPVQGVYLAHQGTHCYFASYKEVIEVPGPHLSEVEEQTSNARVFRLYAGEHRRDETEGSDMWALSLGWVTATPLCLRTDIPMSRAANQGKAEAVLPVMAALLHSVAEQCSFAVGGV